MSVPCPRGSSRALALSSGLPVSPTSGGPFRALPLELVHHVLAFLPLMDVGSLALTSEWLRRTVHEWSATRACTNRVTGQQEEEEPEAKKDDGGQLQPPDLMGSTLTQMRNSASLHLAYAVLVKRMTFLLPSKERIEVAMEAFGRVLPRKNKASSSPCMDWVATERSARSLLIFD